MALEAMDVCLRVLKESNKSRLDGYSVRNCVLIKSHVTFRDYRVHIFCDNLFRNSCIKRSRRRHCRCCCCLSSAVSTVDNRTLLKKSDSKAI